MEFSIGFLIDFGEPWTGARDPWTTTEQFTHTAIRTPCHPKRWRVPVVRLVHTCTRFAREGCVCWRPASARRKRERERERRTEPKLLRHCIGRHRHRSGAEHLLLGIVDRAVRPAHSSRRTSSSPPTSLVSQSITRFSRKTFSLCRLALPI